MSQPNVTIEQGALRVDLSDPLLGLVAGYFGRHGWPAERARIVSALSGGADSVALLYALHTLAGTRRWHIEAAHVNYHLRGEESNEDEAFCRRMCEQLGIRLHVLSVELPKPTGENLQSWARQVRYDFFDELVMNNDFHHVAVGHTCNDRAESVAAAIIEARGTFALAGIPPVRQRIIRPLYDASRATVAAFLDNCEIPFQTDTSNESRKYLRNRVRYDLLPRWEEYNPSIVSGLARLGEQLHRQNEYLERQANEILRESLQAEDSRTVTLNAAKLTSGHSALDPFLVRALAERLGLILVPSASTVERFGELRGRKDTGRVEQGILRIERSKGIIIASRADAVDLATTDPLIVIPGKTLQFGPTAIKAELTGCLDIAVPDDRREAHLDWNQLDKPLVIRQWQHGDRYQPIGLTGHKTLGNLFADRGVPRSVRSTIPVLADAHGVVWPIGHPIAERTRVTSDTKSVLHLEVITT